MGGSYGWKVWVYRVIVFELARLRSGSLHFAGAGDALFAVALLTGGDNLDPGVNIGLKPRARAGIVGGRVIHVDIKASHTDDDLLEYFVSEHFPFIAEEQPNEPVRGVLVFILLDLGWGGI